MNKTAIEYHDVSLAFDAYKRDYKIDPDNALSFWFVKEDGDLIVVKNEAYFNSSRTFVRIAPDWSENFTKKELEDMMFYAEEGLFLIPKGMEFEISLIDKNLTPTSKDDYSYFIKLNDKVVWENHQWFGDDMYNNKKTVMYYVEQFRNHIKPKVEQLRKDRFIESISDWEEKFKIFYKKVQKYEVEDKVKNIIFSIIEAF
jgi:hypothetical protein